MGKLGVTLPFPLAILMSFMSAKDHEDIDIGHEEVVADLIQETHDLEHANPKTDDIISATTRDAQQFPTFTCKPSGICVEVRETGEPFCTVGPFGPVTGCTCEVAGRIDRDRNKGPCFVNCDPIC